MYQVIATKLVVTTTAAQVSQPASMDGANSVQVETTVFAGSGTLSGQLEVSNDLENWSTHGSAQTFTAVGYTLWPSSPTAGIAAAYIRVKWTSNSGTWVLAAGIDTASL